MLNILYCFDNNYYLQGFTAIYSLLENIDEKINIHLIYNLETLKLPLKIEAHKNLNSFKTYQFIEKNINFPNLENAHLTEATYYRLFIEQYLPNDVEKLIYIDGDTVVIKNPIENFYSELNKLENSTFLFAAKTEHDFNTNQNVVFNNHLNLTSKYFNAGILIIDLEKWRSNNLTKKLISHMEKIKNRIIFWDQDVLNSYVNGEYVELDENLNFHGSLLNNSKIQNKNDIKILHFIGGKKPWLTSGALSYPESSNYYHFYYSKLFSQNFHIDVSKGRRYSVIQLIISLINFKFFKLDNPLNYLIVLIKSILRN